MMKPTSDAAVRQLVAVTPAADGRGLLRTREQYLENAGCCGACERALGVIERHHLADQRRHIDGVAREQLERRREPAAARADHVDLLDDDARGVDRRRAVERRLEHERALRAQQIECELEATRSAGGLD